MATLFDEQPEPVQPGRVIEVPVTLSMLKTRFIHRWGYNTTAQDRMAPELDALIEFALKEHRRA